MLILAQIWALCKVLQWACIYSIYNLQRLMVWQLIRKKTYINRTILYGCAATGLPPASASSCHLLVMELITASLNVTFFRGLPFFPALIVCTSLLVRRNPTLICLQRRIIHVNWKKRSRCPLIISQFSGTGAGEKADSTPPFPSALIPDSSVIPICTTRVESEKGFFYLCSFKDDATQFSIICRSLKYPVDGISTLRLTVCSLRAHYEHRVE